MAAQETRYYYKVSLTYINSKKSQIEIDADNIRYVVIDRDFNKINMPVVAIYASIEKNILDDMILNMDNNLMTMSIYMYDMANQNDNVTEKYISDRFIYMIKDDLSKTSKIDYGKQNSELGNNSYTKDVVIWMIQQAAVNSIRTPINGVYKNSDMNSLLLQLSNYVGNILIEPLKYNTKFDQVIIPPCDSLSNYVAFLNDNLNVFYDTPYRFFIDFDCTYLVSSSGTAIKAKNQYVYTISIEIESIDSNTDQETGGYLDTNNHKYTVYVDDSKAEYVKNPVLNKLVNRLTVIDSEGNSIQRVLSNSDAEVTDNIDKIVTVSSTDSNVINNIAYDIESGDVTITVVQTDLDASMFTLNKQYIISDETHDIHAQHFILLSCKQLYTKQTQKNFVLTTVLTFRPVILEG